MASSNGQRRKANSVNKKRQRESFAPHLMSGDLIAMDWSLWNLDHHVDRSFKSISKLAIFLLSRILAVKLVTEVSLVVTCASRYFVFFFLGSTKKSISPQ